MITYPSEYDKQNLHFLQLFHRKLIGVKRDPRSFTPGKAVIIHILQQIVVYIYAMILITPILAIIFGVFYGIYCVYSHLPDWCSVVALAAFVFTPLIIPGIIKMYCNYKDQHEYYLERQKENK